MPKAISLLGLILLMPLCLLANGDTITLKIVDEEGLMIEQALVHDLNNMLEVLASPDGLYRIPPSSSLDTIIISSFGYQNHKVYYPRLTGSQLNEVVLKKLSTLLEEVVIVGRLDQDKQEENHVVHQIGRRQMQQTQSATSADVLEQHSDVFVQRSQFGGGSPIIRGFEASRVLLVVDGVRMNNLIYRSGHLQNAITIDPAALEQMEVIYGPGSLIYGSDALGGVVHFRTRDPKLRFDGKKALNLGAGLRYASAANALVGHVDVNFGTKKWAYFGSFTISNFGDLRAGKRFSDRYPEYGQRPFFIEATENGDLLVANDDPYLQVGTAYHQIDMIHKVKWQPSESASHILNVQYSTSSDIPRYDQLTEIEEAPDQLRFAEWFYGPQDRLMVSTRSEFEGKSLFDKGLVIAAWQNIEESRISRRVGRSAQTNQIEDVNVLSLTADFRKAMGERTELFYGLDGHLNALHSQAFNRDVYTERIGPTLTRYPDAISAMGSFGLYAKGRYKLTEHWSVNYGTRFSYNATELQYHGFGVIEWPADFRNGFTNRNSTATAAASLHFDKGNWSLRALVGSAFRAPNIDDLAKIRFKSGEASVPNLGLEPEKAINGEMTLAGRIQERLQLSMTGFYTHLRDAIVQEPFPLPGGNNMLVFAGDTYMTVANRNAEQGFVRGVSVNVEYTLPSDWRFYSAFNYIKGSTRSEAGIRSPMAHIPPVYGRTGFSFSQDKIEIEGVIRYNGAKPISQYSSNSADNIEKATPEGTLAWATLNFYATWQVAQLIKLQVSLENLTDQHYRPFSSGVSAPGRNLSIGVRIET